MGTRRRLLLALACVFAASALGGCAAPPDSLWHEYLDVQVTKWDIVDDELRVLATVEAPERRQPNSTLSLTFRIDEMHLADAAIDIANTKFSHVARSDGTTGLEFRARLVQAGLATEPRLTILGQCGLTFRTPPSQALVSFRPDSPAGAASWEHPDVPGLKLSLERWNASSVSVLVERPAAGSLELQVVSGGKRVPTEPLSVAHLLRLSFNEGCPKDAELIAIWQPEHRCLATLKAEDIPAADE